MEKEYIMQVADTAVRQLLASIPTPVLWSWGIQRPFFATVHNGMPAVKFKVNGRLHKGYVIIALNEGVDYYEVYLQNKDITILVSDEVCFDELGELIDRHIESGNDKEEYGRFLQGATE